MSAPQSTGIYVPEDIIRLIFEEILLHGDRTTFHATALLSSTFLYVAQSFLYRSCTINIWDPHLTRNLKIFLDIIERQPHICTFVRELNIIEKYPQVLQNSISGKSNDTSCGISSFTIQEPLHHFLTPFVEVFIENKHGFLPRLRDMLTRISTMNLCFHYSQLDWISMHRNVQMALEGLLCIKGLRAAHLHGVVNIPLSISTHIFGLQDVELNDCHFSPVDTSLLNHNIPIAVNQRTEIHRRLSLHLGRRQAGLAHVIQFWRHHGLELPEVKELLISVVGLYGVYDAAVMLRAQVNHVKDLSLSTTRLELNFVQRQPPLSPFLFHWAHNFRLPHIHPHAATDCFATDVPDKRIATLTHQMQILPKYRRGESGDLWFYKMMEQLIPNLCPTFRMLRKLVFKLSHWRSARDVEANGELHWMISWLSELPLESSERVKELSITIHVGTDFCLDTADTMHELIDYQGWTDMDTEVAQPRWKALEKVAIVVRSRTTCIRGIEDRIGLLMGWLKTSRLPRLNHRGILDLHFRSIK